MIQLKKKQMHRITHVIFDCDGTLVNTIDFFQTILNAMLNKLGKQSPGKEFDDAIVNCTNIHDVFPMFAQFFNYDDKETLTKYVYEGLEEVSSSLELMPGVEKLITHLSKHNIPMAIATAGSLSLFKTRTQKFGDLLAPGNHISHVVCGDEDREVKRNKTFPDVYLVCAKRFANPPVDMRNVLVVEDSYDSTKGATSAGMTTLLVPSEMSVAMDTKDYNCDLVLRSLDEFKPELFGLPAY